ncbi:hypothetical protein AGOR_G00226590 [Albula goreensis]|uniref:Secreted protein n=1 Tax=Albula goreensis TaxID=1534307 RepID=A0A8T3CKH9_9TELE|nr:hypothetical protein AGOR_G00226590 [Albula goreensis]
MLFCGASFAYLVLCGSACLSFLCCRTPVKWHILSMEGEHGKTSKRHHDTRYCLSDHENRQFLKKGYR